MRWIGCDPDRHEPLLDQLRPFGDRILRPSQSKSMPAIAIEMHLRRNAGVLERHVIHERLVHVVYAIRLRLEQERGWCVAGDVNVWIERVWARPGYPEMPRIECHREIRADVLSVRGVDGRV